MSDNVKVILGDAWDNHRAGTTVQVDRSRGSWLLAQGGQAADEESARALGVAWVRPKSAPAAKKTAAPRVRTEKKAATPKAAAPATTEKLPEDEKE